jgi:DNA-binding NarL/FixJ family response regulator
MEKKRVLIAESHPMFRQTIADVLANIPWVSLVGKVTNGWDVIRMAVQLKPDIILTDFSLPGLSGLEVTRLIRQAFSEIPVIVLLDKEDEQYVEAVKQSGGWAHLTKSQLTLELPSLLDNLRQAEGRKSS